MWGKKQEKETEETWPPTAQSLRELVRNREDRVFKEELEGIRKFMYSAAKCGEMTYYAYADRPYAYAACTRPDAMSPTITNKARVDVDMLEKIGDVLRLDGFETEMYHGSTMHMLRISWEENGDV